MFCNAISCCRDFSHAPCTASFPQACDGQSSQLCQLPHCRKRSLSHAHKSTCESESADIFCRVHRGQTTHFCPVYMLEPAHGSQHSNQFCFVDGLHRAVWWPRIKGHRRRAVADTTPHVASAHPGSSRLRHIRLKWKLGFDDQEVAATLPSSNIIR